MAVGTGIVSVPIPDTDETQEGEGSMAAPKLTTGIKAVEPSADPFTRLTETTFNGRRVVRDTEIQVAGLGRVRFRADVTNPRNNERWIDVIDRNGAWRSVRPERVKTVHYKTRTRKNEQKNEGGDS